MTKHSCMPLQRRLLIGVAATLALGAFALVPTDSLRPGKPGKPLYLYLIPLLRVQVGLFPISWQSHHGSFKHP